MVVTPLTQYAFTHDGVTRDVVRVGASGPAVILLHELSGVSRPCLELADRLGADFRVHLPVLYGSPVQGDGMAAASRMLCVRREFAILGAGRSSPMASWLRALCRQVSAEAGGRVGAVGMCLTGGLVFSMVLDPSVGAAVASQPSLPWRRGSVTITADELGDTAAAVERAAATGTPVLGLRFADDPICPGSRFDRLAEVYTAEGGTFLRNPPGGDYTGRAHSVLGVDAGQAPGSVETVRTFLLTRLVAV
ncbi:MAG: dienelactone hydrolase family protein [Acidimicrobiia bacterium]